MPEYIEINLESKIETKEGELKQGAVLFSDGKIDEWIPKSLMKKWPKKGQTGTAIIKQWFAKKAGFI